MKFILRLFIFCGMAMQTTACSVTDFFPGMKSTGSEPSLVGPVVDNNSSNTDEDEDEDNSVPVVDLFAAPDGATTLFRGDRAFLKQLVAALAIIEEEKDDEMEFQPIKMALYDDGTGRFLNDKEEKIYEFFHKFTETDSYDLSETCRDGEGELTVYEGATGFDDNEEWITTRIIDMEGFCSNTNAIPNRVQASESIVVPMEKSSCFAMQWIEENPPICSPGKDVCSPEPDICMAQPDICTPQKESCVQSPPNCVTVTDFNGRDQIICTPGALICTPQPDLCVPQPDICSPQADSCAPGPDDCLEQQPDIETMLFEKVENGCDYADSLLRIEQKGLQKD